MAMALKAAKPAETAKQNEMIWRVELLGGMRLLRQDQDLHRFKTRRMTLLLARLACFPNRAHPRDLLAEELWPDESPDTLRERFRQTLSMLRQELEPNGVAAGSVLLADRSNVRLAPGSFSTDVAEFEAVCRTAKMETPARQVELLQQAVTLYRGELLPGFYEDWILTEREHLAETYRQALARLTQAHALLGQFEAALETARKGVATDSLGEQAHCALIRVYAQMGRPLDAQRQYEDLERLLRDQVDAEPTAATQALMAQVRSGVLLVSAPVLSDSDSEAQFAVVALSPAAIPATLSAPADTAALSLSAPAVFSYPAAPHVLPSAPPLPVSMTRFFGRKEEIAHLQTLLTPVSDAAFAPPPLVTLIGPGGAGKTRLALEVARCLRAGYADAVWFVPLADVAHADLIADALVESLHLARSAQTAPLEQSVEFLQAYPVALLVLDNFEHLQEDGTSFVQILRQRLPHVSCLVTSRHKLNVDGERDMALNPLPTPDAVTTPNAAAMRDALTLYPSIQLFLDRAQAARYSFQLTDDNAASVAMLGQKLEGLPLAIELAAAWAATLSPEQILARLSRRFELLVSRRRDIPQRHQSLQAVLEGSYALLPPTLQRLYARLSVFRGGWTLEAAEQVAGVSTQEMGGVSEQAAGGSLHCLDGLALLQERSFVVSEEQGAEMRYRLLESLREFGAEQLNELEQSALCRLHADYFLALTEEARTRQRTPEEKQWFDRLEAETDNLRAALEWTLLHDLETALQMCARVGGFWMTRGFAREGSEWLEKILAAGGGSEQARAEALGCLALMKLALGSYDVGRELAREALAMLRRLGDKPGMAKALNTLGAILMEQGHLQEAQDCYEACLSLHCESGHRTGTSVVLANLGNVAYAQGDYALACTYYSECLEARRALGDRRGIAAALDYLGRAVREQGNFQRASELHSESLAMRRDLNDKQTISMTLNHLATVKIHLDAREEAQHLLSESVALSQEIGDRGSLAEAFGQLGELARLTQEEASARAYWTQSLTILQEAGDMSSLAGLLEAFAGLAHSEAEFYAAAQMLGRADAIRREISNPVRPSLLSRYEQTVTAVRSALGEECFQQAWEEGHTLTVEQAIRLMC